MHPIKAEEKNMKYLWQLEKAFLKDLNDRFPEPKPGTTAVVILPNSMQEKALVDHSVFGNSRQYYPKVKKADYFSKQMNGVIKNFFNNSALQFASFFTKSAKLSTTELEELRKIIDQEMEKKKK